MSENRLEITRRSNGVAQVTMSRPDVFNAFDEVMIADIDSAFEQLSTDDDVRVIVLAGEGKHFSAGADLDWMRRASEASTEWNLEDARKLAAMLYRIDSCHKPTVARVQGAALGGGVGLYLLNQVGDVAFAGASTSAALRALATFDVQRATGNVPLRFHLNFEYFFDNSSALVEEVSQEGGPLLLVAKQGL